jgi:NifU-like protein involved in Fe-S cluster formation
MAYSVKVLDHFQYPRNVGSLDKTSVDVGTGLVGAPECFSGSTLIATADGSNQRALAELYAEGQDIPVWSFNIAKKQFEINMGRAVCTGEKPVDSVTLDDGSTLEVTADHEFLTRPDYKYIANGEIKDESIRPFKRYVSKRGYWRIRDSKENDQYRSIFKFFTGATSMRGFNIHHKNLDKRNDSPNNLKLLTIGERIKEHRPSPKKSTGRQIFDRLNLGDNDIVRISKLLKDKTRQEVADELGVFVDEFYVVLRVLGLGRVRRINTPVECCELSSIRMKKDNPYHKFTSEQKQIFATHEGSSNGRWKNSGNEALLQAAKKILDENGKFTAALWREKAHSLGLPQDIKSRFKSLNEFHRQAVEFNHKIKNREVLGVVPTFTLQVEGNNNYVVITKMTKNSQCGIVVRNCGDVMKLQIKVNKETGVIEEAKFKCFGCGSAIASSSLATEWVKGRTVDEALTIKNTDIVRELNLPPVKIHCSVLAQDAIAAAVTDWKRKQESFLKDGI